MIFVLFPIFSCARIDEHTSYRSTANFFMPWLSLKPISKNIWSLPLTTTTASMPKLQSLVQGCNLLSQTLVQWYACYEEAVFVGSALTSNMYSHGIEKSACVPQKIIDCTTDMGALLCRCCRGFPLPKTPLAPSPCSNYPHQQD